VGSWSNLLSGSPVASESELPRPQDDLVTLTLTPSDVP